MPTDPATAPLALNGGQTLRADAVVAALRERTTGSDEAARKAPRLDRAALDTLGMLLDRTPPEFVEGATRQAEITLCLSAQDFRSMWTGELHPAIAITDGRIGYEGASAQTAPCNAAVDYLGMVSPVEEAGPAFERTVRFCAAMKAL